MANEPIQSPGAFDAFREEFLGIWHRFPDKALFFGLLAAWCALFLFLGNSTFGYVDSPSLFAWLHNAYTIRGSEDGHGLLIPLVVLGLLWWKRQLLDRVRKAPWLGGVLILGAAAGMHLVGYLIQQPRLSAIALFVGVQGLIMAVWGLRFGMACFFPMVLFAFCIPMSTVAERVTVPLRHVSTEIAVFGVRDLLGIAVVNEGVQIMDPKGTYAYEVAAACSGINSLIALLALNTIFAMISFTKRWKRLFMVMLALPLALASNVLRLVSIVVAAEAFGQGAGEFVHEWFGFVTFGLALALMMGIAHWMRETDAAELVVTAPRVA